MDTYTLPFSADISRAARLATETTRLDLLADIDATVDRLSARARELRDMAVFFSRLESEISAAQVVKGHCIDPDFILTSTLERLESDLEAYLPRMMVKRTSIDKDTRLSDAHCESLHDIYDEVMEEAALLHEAIQLARAAIITYDLAAEPKESLPAFDSCVELIDALREN
ncbi:MAG: hypothetical protein LBO79_06285 [Zoogloeaceae bacterium]|jgi:hypothetical protein|nr:hypothetical protein [Zoogloeaceae bacterium]